MTKENEEKPSNVIKIPCNWCGMVDERKIIFKPLHGAPRDSGENQEPFHEECNKADKIFYVLLFLDIDISRKQMVKTANKLAGVDINRRKVINFFQKFKRSSGV